MQGSEVAMSWLGQAYIPIVLLSALLAAALASYAWRHRHVPGATPAVIGFGGLALWAPAVVLAMTAPDAATATFWIDVSFVGMVPLPVAWLAMVLQYTGREHWLTPRRLGLLCVVPLFTVVLAWTSGFHGLVHGDVRWASSGLLATAAYDPGPWYWVHAAFSYLVGAANGVVLFSFLLHAPRPYRSQSLAVLGGAFLPVFASIIDLFDLPPMGALDMAPVLAGPGALIIAWGIFRRRLFDVAPIARHKIVEGLGDAVVVLDARGRIIDLNSAAQQIFGHSLSQALGQPAEDTFCPCPELLDLYRKPAEVRAEFYLGEGSERCYDGYASPLIDGRDRTIGRAIILRDITERKRTEALLLDQQRTAAMLEEHERLVYQVAEVLHGRVQNSLLLAVHHLDACELLLPADSPKCLAILAEAKKLIDEVREKEIREASHRLHPLIVDLGLVPAVRSLASTFDDTFRLELHVGQGRLTRMDDPDDNLIPMPVRLAAYRILEEVLSNVRRHAGASEVHVSLQADAERGLLVSVRDDGRGFEANGTNPGLGLRLIAGRAQSVGGKSTVSSVPGLGTTVSVEIPLPKGNLSPSPPALQEVQHDGFHPGVGR